MSSVVGDRILEVNAWAEWVPSGREEVYETQISYGMIKYGVGKNSKMPFFGT